MNEPKKRKESEAQISKMEELEIKALRQKNEEQETLIKEQQEEINALNERIISLTREKIKVEEEKNKDISQLQSKLTDVKVQLNQKEIEKEESKLLIPSDDIENSKAFVSDLIKVISKYKEALNSIDANQDIFIRSLLFAKIISNFQQKNEDLLTIKNDKNFLEKLKNYEEEIKINRKKVDSLTKDLETYKNIIKEYKEKLSTSLEKMHEMIKYIGEIKSRETGLKNKLDQKTKEFELEKQKYLQDNYKNNVRQRQQNKNICIYLKNILDHEKKELNKDIIPNEIRELLEKNRIKYSS